MCACVVCLFCMYTPHIRHTQHAHTTQFATSCSKCSMRAGPLPSYILSLLPSTYSLPLLQSWQTADIHKDGCFGLLALISAVQPSKTATRRHDTIHRHPLDHPTGHGLPANNNTAHTYPHIKSRSIIPKNTPRPTNTHSHIRCNVRNHKPM